jgi:hypothetical protein
MFEQPLDDPLCHGHTSVSGHKPSLLVGTWLR